MMTKKNVLIAAGVVGLAVVCFFAGALVMMAGDESTPGMVEIEVTRIVDVEVEKIQEVETIQEVEVPIEVEVTRIVEVAALEPTLAPSGEAYDPKGVGVYLTPVDMAPGIWRSSGTGDSDGDCWLQIYSLSGERAGGGFEPVGFSLRIPDGDLQIVIGQYSAGCTWTWISE